MKIALNTTIADQTRTGTGTYAVQLAAALMRAAHDFELTIYCRRELCDWFDRQRNGHLVEIRGVDLKSTGRRIFWEQARLGRELRRGRVALLHSLAFTSPLAGSVKTVLTVHDLAFRKYPHTIPLSKRLYYGRVFGRSIRHASAVITPSEVVRQSLIETFELPAEKVRAVPEGVTPEFFTPPDRQTVAKITQKYGIDKPYLLTVATLEPRKNLKTVLAAFDLLKKSSESPLQLVVVGKKGWLVSDAGLQNGDESGIIRTGYVAQEELRALYAGAELFLFPSHYEGFGLPLLEAAASGTPVLASDIPVHREVCGDAAQFVKPDDIEGWKNTIGDVLGNAGPRQELAAKGRERAKQFTWQKTAEKTLEVYREVL